MKVVFGLGNPGTEYNNTRHNAGFMLADSLAKQLNAGDWKYVDKFKAQISEAQFAGHKILIVKPQTFMNLSGISAERIVNFFKLEQEDLTVAYDDVDLDEGVIRLRMFGSAGTHNGAKSIKEHLGGLGMEFPRIRIGVNSSIREEIDIDLSNFVLKKMNKSELHELQKGIDKGVECLLFAWEEGFDAAMQAYNG
ncbi:aminoacyl-tRNA hydrolase [Patescibacteria group bacterium]|nr:aminoacyl-tRNA hydrolase [Patescibacteria group bacterium]